MRVMRALPWILGASLVAGVCVAIGVVVVARAGPEPEPEVLAAIEERAWIHAAAGFTPEAKIARDLFEAYEEDLPGDPARTRAAIERIVREQLDRQRREQAGWPPETDVDRLGRAFAKLEAQGVVCRENFTCCGTCGGAEIGDEMERAKKAGRPVHGYAFFHSQDTERAVEGGGLYLNYGAPADEREPALAVAREIAAAIGAEGLAVEWDGTWERRIHVKLDWRKRR